MPFIGREHALSWTQPHTRANHPTDESPILWPASPFDGMGTKRPRACKGEGFVSFTLRTLGRFCGALLPRSPFLDPRLASKRPSSLVRPPSSAGPPSSGILPCCPRWWCLLVCCMGSGQIGRAAAEHEPRREFRLRRGVTPVPVWCTTVEARWNVRYLGGGRGTASTRAPVTSFPRGSGPRWAVVGVALGLGPSLNHLGVVMMIYIYSSVHVWWSQWPYLSGAWARELAAPRACRDDVSFEPGGRTFNMAGPENPSARRVGQVVCAHFGSSAQYAAHGGTASSPVDPFHSPDRGS